MKKNYIFLVLAILFSGTLIAQEAQKNFINYQGVARNGADQLMANESMTIGIALKMGSATGASAYAENHSVTTDANGVFSLKIGNGESVSGAFNTIPWGSEATFVTVLVNGSEIGTTEMMAVPYALSSGDGSQSATDVPYDNAVSGLTATNAQEAIDELAGSGAVDADADPTNEFQTLSFDAITNELSLTDGNSITIPTGGTDGDADATNEIQNLTLAGTNLEISGGTGVDLAALIPPGGTDDQNASEVPFDNSTSTLTATDTQAALVELAAGGSIDTDDQNLSLSGTLLQISDGTGVDLAPIIPPGGTDDQNAVEVPYDNTASPLAATDTQAAINELATSGLVDTDDQDLSLSGTMLQISDGTGVDLAPIIPPGGTDDQNASEVPFDNSTSTLTATDTQSALVELATGGLVDTDDQALVLTGDLLTIEDGAGSVDLSAYIDDPDATTETGILTGDGATVSGLVGTSDGQVAKWNAGTNTWEAGTDATGGGGSSLWSENGDDLFYEDGNVGIGTNDVRASLHVKENSTPVQPLLTLEEEGDDFARIAIRNEGVPALWNIMGRSYDPAAGAEISNINFRYINGLGGQEDVMTIAGNRRVGINTLTPEANLDVVGTIRSSDLAGAGERNVLADADGNLFIGAGGGGSSLWTEHENGIWRTTENVGIGSQPATQDKLVVATSDPAIRNGIRSRISGNGTYKVAISGRAESTGSGNTFGNRSDVYGESTGPVWAYAGYVGGAGTGSKNGLQLTFFDSTVGTKTGINVIGEDRNSFSGNVGIGTTTPSAKLDVVGDIRTSGEINRTATGDANMVPIAYGTVSPNGNLTSGSGNVSVTKERLGEYEVSISGESYFYTRYTSQLTINTSDPHFIGTNSVGGNLTVTIHDASGAEADAGFTFVVYKN